MQSPVIVVNTNTERESGRKAQLANIVAAKVGVVVVFLHCIGVSWF